MEAIIPDENVDKLHDPLELLGLSLTRTLESTISDRSLVEQRWVADLQQYQGEYDQATRQLFDKIKDRSSVYLNITRTATNLSVAQLADLLFPTDDKNYGIGPAPHQQVQEDLMSHEPATTPEGEAMIDPETGEPLPVSELAHHAMMMATDKAKKMEREIETQLKGSRYARQARRALFHAGLLGTGVLCGPEGYMAEAHSFAFDEEEKKTSLTIDASLKPRARHVNVWDFYPDMSAATLEDAEFIFERSYMTINQALSLRGVPGVIEDNLRKLLGTKPRETRNTSSRTTQSLSQLVNGGSANDDNRYEFWTYTGPIDKAALISAKVKGIEEDDPTQYFEGTVIFCNGIVIKAALNPLEIEHRPYSVFNWQADEFSIFGYGIPHTCRNEQRILNTAWRMMLDNAAKSAGPQVIMKRSAVVPADGTNNYTMEPWKVWLADETVSDVRQAFTVFSFPSVQEEINNILVTAREFLNQTVGLPPQPGEGSGQAPSTLGGQAMLMNSSNTDRRRQVRDWDDDITTPMITRFYHWNMQYNPNEEIKGDYAIIARGTSALLMREQQAINLMAVLDKYAAHPMLAEAIKGDGTLRKIIEAMHINPDEVVKTEDELAAEAQAAAEQEPEPDPQQIIEEMRLQATQLREETKQELALFKAQFEAEQGEADRQLKRDLAMLEVQREDRRLQIEAMRIAQNTDTSYQKILADLKKFRAKSEADMHRFNKELELKAKEGPRGNIGLETNVGTLKG